MNVYNATAKSGLAGRTAEELKKRGFTIGKVGNAPAELDKKVPGTAQVIAARPAPALPPCSARRSQVPPPPPTPAPTAPWTS